MDAAHQQAKILTILCVVGMIAVAVYSITYVTNALQKQSQLIYALVGDEAVSLRAISVTDNRPVEAYNHVDLFHRNFYTLDPEREVIDYNIDRALTLGDNSVRTLVQDYEEDNYYRKLIASNTSQRIAVDSIALDMSTYPYEFRYIGKLTITRTSSIATRTLVTQGLLRDVQRSKNNPHGFLIERYEVTENDDLKVVQRY